MDKHLSEDFTPSWVNLLATLSVQKGVELAEKLLQGTKENDYGKDCFHWPCFLRKLSSHKLVITCDRNLTE